MPEILPTYTGVVANVKSLERGHQLLRANPRNNVAPARFGYRLMYFTQNLLAHFSYKQLADFLLKFTQIPNI